MTDIVKKMWAAYCEAAGGVTYDGKPLPTWEELGDDRQKCWVAVGKEAADEIERLRKALRPFAEIGDAFLPADGHDNSCWATTLDNELVRNAEIFRITVGDCRNAAIALGEKE